MANPIHPYPPPRAPRYRSLDLWRGVSCLTIVVHHAAQLVVGKEQAAGHEDGSATGRLLTVLSYGWVAVPWFFVISGYCITATVDSTRRKSGASLEFFRKRVRRIFPPYWAILALMLLAYWAAAGAGRSDLLSDANDFYADPSRFTPSGWFGNVTLTETWRYHVFGPPGNLMVGQAWSLCYEEQFYAISGLILILMPGRIFSGFAAVTAFSLALMALRALRVVPALDGFFFDGKWVMFATGVALYHAINHAGRRGRIATLLALCLGATLPAFPPIWSALKTLGPSFIASSAIAAVMLALQPLDDRTVRCRPLRPLFLCGRMCYSMYLVHILVALPVSHVLYDAGLRGAWQTLLVTVPLATGLSVALSWLFYLGVERHFLNAPPPARDPVRRAGPALEPARSGGG